MPAEEPAELVPLASSEMPPLPLGKKFAAYHESLSVNAPSITTNLCFEECFEL